MHDDKPTVEAERDSARAGFEFELQKRANENLARLVEGVIPIDDPVRPAHYRGDLVMRIIETFDLGFELGNVIKYVLRHKAKDGIEALRKAAWYLQRRIEQLEGKHQDGLK